MFIPTILFIKHVISDQFFGMLDRECTSFLLISQIKLTRLTSEELQKPQMDIFLNSVNRKTIGDIVPPNETPRIPIFPY